MVKLLYLLAGITLKQLVDETKSIHGDYLNYLKKIRESVGTYKQNPAIEAGTREAHSAIARHNYMASVQPELKKLSRKILIVRAIPMVCYLILTIVLLIWIGYLEQHTSQ